MEIRLKDIQLDYNQDQRKLGGYINVVERSSETMFSSQRGKWFNETIKAGTFTRALQKNKSIPLLLEHDWDKEIAHTSKGTLELREDAIGLRFDAIVDEETFKEIERRNISSCSFGFKVVEQQFEPVNPKLEKRYISNLDLFEVSLVANPAYVGSLVEQRAMEKALEEMNKEIVEETKEELVEEVRAEEKEEESEKESDNTVEENAQEEESTDTVEQEQEEVSETDSTEEKEEESEERTVTIDTTSSDVKEDAKEVIEQVIEQTQKDAEFYGDIAKDIDDYKEEVKQEMETQIESLENESLYYTTLAYTKWLEVAKLKQINMNL